MITTLVIIIIGIVLLFGSVVFFGPPYVPTLAKQIDATFDLLAMRKGQTLLELGSGDGRVLRAAAERGLYAVGIELNPLLVIYSRLVTWRYRKQVRIVWGSVWSVSWPAETDAIFTFMLQRQMHKLDEAIISWRQKVGKTQPMKLASFAFYIPDKRPHEKRDGVFLYEYK